MGFRKKGWEGDKGFYPRMKFYNIMHNGCLAHEYCVYEIFSLLSIFVVKINVTLQLFLLGSN